MRVDVPVPSSALAVGAHPDDIEFECGGTLAKWGAAGAAIHLLICTDGSKGTWDVDADTDVLIARRQAEQREAARRIHPDAQVHFLGQQHRIEAWVVGPRVGMRPDADGRLGLAHDARRAPASQRSLPPGIVWTCSVQSEPFQ